MPTPQDFHFIEVAILREIKNLQFAKFENITVFIPFSYQHVVTCLYHA